MLRAKGKEDVGVQGKEGDKGLRGDILRKGFQARVNIAPHDLVCMLTLGVWSEKDDVGEGRDTVLDNGRRRVLRRAEGQVVSAF